MSKIINPNTKQNPILQIKLNQNKQIWKKEKKKKRKREEQADLTQLGGGEDDERRWRCWSGGGDVGDAVEAQADLSLSLSLFLSLSDVKQMWDAGMFLRWKRK